MIRARLKELPIEEVANSVTHGLGLVLSVLGFAMLVIMAAMRGSGLLIAGCVIYGVSLVVLYSASTAYHMTTSPELKSRLQVLDHCCIYLLIAGSYTPFGLVILKANYGVDLLAAIWAFAVIGILVKLALRQRFPALSVVSYIVMGWLGLFALQPIFAALGMGPVLLAVAGGIAYTVGVVFFAWHRVPHNHAIFHVFVLAGSVLHYLAVVVYVVPLMVVR